MSIDELIDEKVQKAIDARLSVSVEIDLIDPEEAAKICDCDKSVILSLVHDQSTGFPAAKLGPRTIRIDRNRLAVWIQNGGLNGIDK